LAPIMAHPAMQQRMGRESLVLTVSVIPVASLGISTGISIGEVVDLSSLQT
jgi:hypothetical protein